MSLGSYDYVLLASQVGTGTNAGQVRTRLVGGSSNPTLEIDFMYVEYAIVNRSSNFTGVAL